jgi:hypothetical protein
LAILRNRVTGASFRVGLDKRSRSLGRFRLSCKGFDRYCKENGLSVYFLTLTLRDESIETANKDLNRFLSWLRGRYKKHNLPVRYVWAVELQKRRYYARGVAALHWHIAVGAIDGSLPNIIEKTPRGKPSLYSDGSVITLDDLSKYWGKGFVWSVEAWSQVWFYLSKYFAKDDVTLADYNSSWDRLRRFGASQFGYLGFADWGYVKIKEYLDAERWRKGQSKKKTCSGACRVARCRRLKKQRAVRHGAISI